MAIDLEHPLEQDRFVDRPAASPEDLFRWARFLDEGQTHSFSRRCAVAALLDAATDEPEGLYET
jgi:hypothetical protein